MVMSASAFGVSVPTVTTTIRSVCSAIVRKLGPSFIHLPRDINELKEKIAGWKVRYGFPQCLGAVNGTHIPISKPYINPQDYFSYKLKYTFNVQAVCDYQGCFMDMCHVFANSAINNAFKLKNIPNIFCTLVPGKDEVGIVLLGDLAYPLLPYVMEEYAQCQDDSNFLFNQML